MMFAQIVTQIPIWVWPLLVGLVWLGLRATKERTVPVSVYFIMPLLGLLSLTDLSNLPNQILVWGAYATGMLIGYRLQAQWTLGIRKSRVQVAGEWVTFFTIMIVFVASFVNGMLEAIAPEILTNPAIHIGFVVVKAAVSGIFLGRALSIIIAMQRPAADANFQT